MKKLSSILMAAVLILQLCTFTISAEVPENTTNLVTNGDFESGDTGWTLRQPNGGATFSIAQTGGIDGSNCAYVDKAQGAGDLILPISMSGLSAGDVLNFSAKVKLAGNCPNGKTTSTAKWIGNNALLDTTGATVSGDWVNVSYTTTLTDALLSSGEFALRVSHPGNTDNYDGGYYMDDVKVVCLSESNLVYNPNFNYGTEGWEFRNSTTYTMTAQATGGVDNSACIQVSNGAYMGDIRQYIHVEEGETYYAEAKIKLASETNNGAGMWYRYKDSNNTEQASVIVQNATVTEDGYTKLSGTFTVPAGATKSELAIRPSGDNSVASYIDDVYVVKVETTGALVNPSFESGIYGWTQNNATQGHTAETVYDANAPEGSYYAKVTCSSSNGAPELYQTYNFTKNKLYVISAKVKFDGATTDNAVYPAIYADKGWRDSVTITDSNWTELKTVFVSTTGDEQQIFVRLRETATSGNKAAGYTYYIDDFSIEEYDSAVDYNPSFDNGLAGWTYTSGCTATVETEGTNSYAKLVSTNTIADLNFWHEYEVGKKYVISAKIKFENAGNQTYRPQFVRLDGPAWDGYIDISDSEWHNVRTVITYDSSNITSGSEMRQATIRIKQLSDTPNADGGYDYVNAPAGYTYYLDDFSVEEVTPTSTGLWHEAAFTGSATTEGSLAADVELYNGSGAGVYNNMAVLALYDKDGKLIDCDVVNGWYVVGECVGEKKLTVDVPTGGNTDGYAKVYVWSKDLTPYSAPSTIN